MKNRKRVRIVHISLRVFNSDLETVQDLKKVAALKPHVILGTESGDVARRALIHETLDALGYDTYAPRGTDSWIAVKRRFIDSNWTGHLLDVLPSGAAADDPHHYQAKGIVSLVGHNRKLGILGFAVTHGLTLGRRPNQAQHDKPGDPVDHFAENNRLMRALCKVGDSIAALDGLAWVSTDSNRRDQNGNVFNPKHPEAVEWITGWDETNYYPSTLDGSTSAIDVIATRKDTKRIKLVGAFVADDLNLRSDHKAVVHDYDVRKKAA